MRSFWLRRLPLVAALLLALWGGTALAQSDSDASDGSTLYLDVGNPSPGDSIHVGAFTMDGIAFDSASEGWPGIDHVEIFLDSRDAGGTLVGWGAMGASAAQPDDPALAGAGWAARVEVPRKLIGPHLMFVYAFSGVTGAEMAVAIPVIVVP